MFVNKRKRLSAIIVILLVLSGSVEASERLNVLLLAVDDLNTWLLDDANRYEGQVVAPNIRQFAASSVVFRHAYAASPYCSPSRTALLSGVSPWKSGVYDNGVNTNASEPLNQATSLPLLFKQGGYFTASYGKIAHGWKTKGAWDDLLPHKRDPVPPTAPLSPAASGEHDWGPTHLAESEMRDTIYADRAIAQLNRDYEKPFLIACGLFHPHMPWYVPQKYFDLFPLEDVVLPKRNENDLDDLPPLASRVLTKRKVFERTVATGEYKKAVQGYLATTAYADAQVGRVLDALDASPYRDNTVVVLISDHGFHLGEKDHWQKATLWEEATHCLLMIHLPKNPANGLQCDRFVSLQDLYPTLAEICNLTKPGYVDGHTLLTLLNDPDAEWESTSISALYDRFITIRTDGFRYIRYAEGQEELYDMVADPHQWANLIGQKTHAADLHRLRKLVPAIPEMAIPLPSKKNKQTPTTPSRPTTK
ncbi:MAG: sulfatase [Planctomycetota bacterium]